MYKRIILALLFIALLKPIYHYSKQTFYKISVLKEDPALLQRLGRHLVIGYSNRKEVEPLIKQGFIGGVYITKRNQSTISNLATWLHQNRIVYKEKQNLPFWTMADQESGYINHLSPMLPKEKGIRHYLNHRSRKDLESMGQRQGTSLLELGVNVNLSPVVDLMPPQSQKESFWTQLSQRSISKDPYITSLWAESYSKGLLKAKVAPTLKHFPGLASVQEDTHTEVGILNKSKEELLQKDWIPFQNLISLEPIFIMVGHVLVPQIDSINISSNSKTIIQDILRNSLGHQGIVITDDLCMNPSNNSKNPIGKSAIKALQAGVDLLLISKNGSKYYEVMYNLIQAYKSGTITDELLRASDQRLNNTAKFFSE